MQAQDARSMLWSLGVRLPGTTVTAIRAALEQRSVVRTWPMRGTLHLVPALDARWMTGLMAGRTATAESTRRRQLGLTDADADHAAELLGASLAGGRRLTRAECLAVLAAGGVPVAGQAGYHLLAQACKRGVACLAPDVGAEQTLVLLDDWASGQRSLERDEALATIALRYVRSHGPVSRRDLAGWTGLPLGDVDRGLAAAGAALTPVTVDGVPMIVSAGALDGGGASGPPGRCAFRLPAGSRLALPGFDEFLLGYKDRSLLLATPEHLQAVVPGGNGVFRPTLVRDGQVAGTWTRTLTRGRLLVEARPLVPLGADDREGFRAALSGYAAFLEAAAMDVRWPG
jgi:hypothetical protein